MMALQLLKNHDVGVGYMGNSPLAPTILVNVQFFRSSHHNAMFKIVSYFKIVFGLLLRFEYSQNYESVSNIQFTQLSEDFFK